MSATTCPVCGSPVRVVGSDEGTQHYEPDTGELARLRTLVAAARQVLRSRDAIDKGSVGGPSYRVAVGALDALDAAMTNPPALADPKGATE